MNNFFNYIGVADIERVHSSVIAWMLSENCHAFSQTVKSKILRKMFGVDENNITYSKIGSQVESDHIDIVFTTNQNDMKTLWVVENKIKSLEHKVKSGKWQTEEYADKILEKNSEGVNHFVLLSLTGEDAKSINTKWHSLKYEDLYNIFNEAERATDNDQATKSHIVIVNEYLGSLWNIIDSLKKFINRPEDFFEIFHKLPNRDKENHDNDQETIQFILSNNLESIFQIALYNEIVKCIKCCYNDKCEDLKEYNISGSARNGDAEIIFKAQTIGQIGTDKITIAISFQSGTYKIVIAADDAYQSNDTKRWDKCFDIIRSYGIGEKSGDWRYNESKHLNNHQKPRVSITKRLSSKSNWYEDKTYQELVKIMCDGFNEALDKKKEILRFINSKHKNEISNLPCSL